MKLSDKDLHYALWRAEKHTGNSLYTEAMAGLEDGTLEIEGYERVQWTKFDPDDPKTFPEDDKMVLAYGFPDPDDNRSCAVYFFAWADSAGVFAGQESADPEVHFWRPLPKPPVEQEEKCG